MGIATSPSRLLRREFLAAAAAAPRPRRPSVLVVHGPTEAGRPAGMGLEFTRAYAACPTQPLERASILTGRFPHAMRPGGRCAGPTLLSELQGAGYVTDCIGDWGCGARAGAGPTAIEFLRANIPNDWCLCVASGAAPSGLLEALDGMGLAADTVVVLTSGGGEDAREESVRVPLRLRYPRRIPRGGTVEFPVSTVDLAPTLLGLCGLEAPREMHGRDLAELLLTGRGDPPESIYAEGRLGEDGEWRMIVRGLDKLVVNARLEATHLYNLGQDPEEAVDLASDGAERRKRDELMALLRRWILATGDRPGGR